MSSTAGKIAFYPQCLVLCVDKLGKAGTMPLPETGANQEDVMRTRIRDAIVAYVNAENDAFKAQVKQALQWLLNGGYEQTYPDSPLSGCQAVLGGVQGFALPDNGQDLFIWIWQELYGEEQPWVIENFSVQQYREVSYSEFLKLLGTSSEN